MESETVRAPKPTSYMVEAKTYEDLIAERDEALALLNANEDAFKAAEAERDALRAEVERLTRERDDWCDAARSEAGRVNELQDWSRNLEARANELADERDALRAEVETLAASLAARIKSEQVYRTALSERDMARYERDEQSKLVAKYIIARDDQETRAEAAEAALATARAALRWIDEQSDDLPAARLQARTALAALPSTTEVKP